MITHILFDFFGTLVEYSPSRTEQGYGRSFRLLREAGATFDYEAFLSLWSAVSAEFDAVAERTHREFSMLEVGRAFLERAVARAPEALVADFVRTYVEEWSKGVSYLPRVPELLSRLHRRFTLAIVTNTHDPDLVPGHLQRMGVAHLFQRVVTSVELAGAVVVHTTPQR